jgi:hypothetical protein
MTSGAYVDTNYLLSIYEELIAEHVLYTKNFGDTKLNRNYIWGSANKKG